MMKEETTLPAGEVEVLDTNCEKQAEQALAAMREETKALKLVIDYEEPLRQIGQLEALEFTRRVVDVAIAQIFENMRNSGKYKGLPYVCDDGQTRRVGSLEEFCSVKLGKSYNRCLELSQNLRALGPSLYEQTERLGLRNIDYKAIRSLAAPEQELIRRAVEEAQSRDEVLDLLQELAAKHAREKEEITRQVDELKGELKATEEISAEKTQRIETLQREAKRIAAAPPDQVLADLQAEATRMANDVRGGIIGALRQALIALDLQEARPTVFMAGLVGQLEDDLRALRAEFALPEVSADEHGWIDARD